MNLSQNAKVTRVSNAVAAGISDINSSSVDMFAGGLEYNSVMFSVEFGTITASAVTSVKIQSSDDDSAWSDVTGSSQTVADTDDNKVFLLDAGKVQSRYLRCVVDRGTANAVVDGILAIQYNGDGASTHDSSVAGSAISIGA